VTDKTSTQNLTRTTDDPKQMAGYLGTLAREVDQRMRAHYYDLSRSQRRPFAVLRKTVPEIIDTSLVSDASIHYDTVDVDTGGMIDLSVSDITINLREPGWYCLGGYLLCTGFGAVNTDVWMAVNGGYNAVRDGGLAFSPVTVSYLTQITAPDQNIGSQMLWSGSSTTSSTTILSAQMWAYKVRDL
jgi:hypothetical protein